MLNITGQIHKIKLLLHIKIELKFYVKHKLFKILRRSILLTLYFDSLKMIALSVYIALITNFTTFK